MAGRDTDFRGDAMLAPDATVGLLEQEPHLDEAKDVRGNVEDGVAGTRALLDRFNELAANYSDETADEFAAPPGADRRRRRVEPRHERRVRDGRAAPAAGRRRRRRSSPAASAAASRCAGCCSRRPTCCSSTSRRTTSTPSRSRGSSSTSPSTRAPSSRSPTIATSSTTSPAGSSSSTARRGIPYEGNYSSWLEQKQARLAQEERTEKARQKTIAAELEWVRQNPKGRQTKQKARLQNFEALVAQERNVKLDEVQIHIPAGPRLGDVVVEAEHLRKGFGDRLLIDDLSFSLPRGGIVGVIGPNGAGKTTLFRMITGQEQPDAGELRVGDTVSSPTSTSRATRSTPRRRVWEEISDGLDQLKVGDRMMNSRQYVAGFNFKGSDQQKKVAKLSGGERNRLHLAKLLRTGGNLLLLDEPTNDLDVDTLRALEEALLDFAGCAVVISHDRWFLDRIATHVLAFEGDSQVTWFEGNFEAYEEHRRALLGAEADRPHRITYKRLTRT